MLREQVLMVFLLSLMISPNIVRLSCLKRLENKLLFLPGSQPRLERLGLLILKEIQEDLDLNFILNKETGISWEIQHQSFG